jgi:hypothetical protein
MVAAVKKKPLVSGDQELKKKWSSQVMKCGWIAVPWLVVEKQADLGLTPSELNLLLHLWKHWWQNEMLPFPSHASIAAAMGKTTNHIQRMTKELERRNIIEIRHRALHHGGQTSNEYSFEGLKNRLKTMAEEEMESRQEKEEKKPGARPFKKAPARAEPKLRVVKNGSDK